MMDLIERLRICAERNFDSSVSFDAPELCSYAADEIEQLRSEADSAAEQSRIDSERIARLVDANTALIAERDLFLKDVGAQQGTIGALKRKLVLAEADRDALRSRIEGALVVHDVTGKYGFVGKRVALVVLEDGKL